MVCDVTPTEDVAGGGVGGAIPARVYDRWRWWWWSSSSLSLTSLPRLSLVAPVAPVCRPLEFVADAQRGGALRALDQFGLHRRRAPRATATRGRCCASRSSGRVSGGGAPVTPRRLWRLSFASNALASLPEGFGARLCALREVAGARRPVVLVVER